MPAPLRLEVADFQDADHWRWVLKEAGGAFLADHTVALDRTERLYPGMVDLAGYLRSYAAPDTRDADERRLIAEVGAWLGAQLLGRRIAEALLTRANPSVVVRVVLPPQAERLLTLPLEVAALDQRRLSAAGVCFVIETTGKPPPPAEPIGERLRMLALFSLPPGGSPLNLRRERQMLRDTVRTLTRTRGRAIDLRVLQYGVTRASLAEALDEAEGWDIIHFSGHGLPGSLLLEKPDGAADHLPSGDLAGLLRQAGQRLKLVVLSSCLSASASIDQTLTWLGLSQEAAPRRDAAAPAGSPAASPTVARALTQALDCAVLAMRYSVEDEFAMHLGRQFYDFLLDKQQPLPEALRRGLAKTLDRGPCGALSAAAPALFGGKAAGLVLAPPEAADTVAPPSPLAEFPRQRDHFVGRVAAMTRASTALAAESANSGVLFLGMAGAGKSSCAVELAHHHESARRFRRFVWFEAPKQDEDIGASLANFALTMERDLPGCQMVGVVAHEAAFRAWLPKLVSLLDRNAVLVVLDNMETLLTGTGQWRDPMWGALIAALLTPGGLSRTVLTSRTKPADLPASTAVIAVHALPRDEALLLVRELPHLRRLLDSAAGRELARRTVRLVQGHPKLIELAEAQAADPARLTVHLDAADQAQTEGAAVLDAFFRDGDSSLAPEAYTAELQGWTRGIAATLEPAAQLFFQVLCAIEENDREGEVLAANWNDVWQRLGHTPPAADGAKLLAALVAAALVDRQATGDGADDWRAVIHPGVAEAGRAAAGADIQAAVDRELAAMWHQVLQQALAAQGKAVRAHGLIVRAGQAGLPYLSRLGDWARASWMIERVVERDRSPATIAALLPAAQRIADATDGTDRDAVDRVVLAHFLRHAGRMDEAETSMRWAIARSTEDGNFAVASSACGALANLLRDEGQLRQALEVLQQMSGFTRRAGHGPWSLLAEEGRQLQIRAQLGETEAVLARALAIRAQMAHLPDPPEANDWSVDIWNVREVLLDIGRAAARDAGQWERSLELSADIRRSKAQRGAGRLEQAQAAFNEYGPLLRLKRYQDAGSLLEECRAVFESEGDIVALGVVLSGLADLADERGDVEAARRFEESALRYLYVRAAPEPAAVSHHNLSTYLRRLGADWRDVLGHRLAASLLYTVTRQGQAEQSRQALAASLRQAGDQAASALPADFAALCATVEQVPGVRFRDLMEGLEPDEAALDEKLRTLIAEAGAQE